MKGLQLGKQFLKFQCHSDAACGNCRGCIKPERQMSVRLAFLHSITSTLWQQGKCQLGWLPCIRVVACERWDARTKCSVVFTRSLTGDVSKWWLLECYNQLCCWLHGTLAPDTMMQMPAVLPLVVYVVRRSLPPVIQESTTWPSAVSCTSHRKQC